MKWNQLSWFFSYHLCIGRTLHTSKNSNDFVGINGIGTEWWCGDTFARGSFNVKCSDLVDYDIADDVNCASIILSQYSLSGWHVVESTYKLVYEALTNECLAEIDVFTFYSFIMWLKLKHLITNATNIVLTTSSIMKGKIQVLSQKLTNDVKP